MAVVSWQPPNVRGYEITVSDFPDWPVPTSGQRGVSVEKGTVSPSGRVALLVHLTNEISPGEGWLIHTTALVILDSKLRLVATGWLPHGLQAIATDMAWTRDGSIMLLDATLNDIGNDIGPGRWLAIRVSESGQIERKVADPGYRGKVSLTQVYLPASDRILVVSDSDVAIVAVDTGEVIHHTKSKESVMPSDLIVSADERHARALGFHSATLWELPVD